MAAPRCYVSRHKNQAGNLHMEVSGMSLLARKVSPRHKDDSNYSPKPSEKPILYLWWHGKDAPHQKKYVCFVPSKIVTANALSQLMNSTVVVKQHDHTLQIVKSSETDVAGSPIGITCLGRGD